MGVYLGPAMKHDPALCILHGISQDTRLNFCQVCLTRLVVLVKEQRVSVASRWYHGVIKLKSGSWILSLLALTLKTIEKEIFSYITVIITTHFYLVKALHLSLDVVHYSSPFYSSLLKHRKELWASSYHVIFYLTLSLNENLFRCTNKMHNILNSEIYTEYI